MSKKYTLIKLEEKEIPIENEEGNVETYEILMTFTLNDFDKNYMVVSPYEEDEEGGRTLLVYSFDLDDAGKGETGDLYMIETDDEWDLIEEIINEELIEPDEDAELEIEE